jgi:hypothetical protein
MSVELDVDAACGVSQALDLFEDKQELQTTAHYHKLIFAPPYYPVQSKSNVAKDFQNKESIKAEAVVANRLDKKIMKPSTEVEGSISFSIGPDGVNFEGAEVRGSASDDKGNHVDASVNYDHESGTADVSVGGGTRS